MARKELNNKVEFMAGGESLIMKSIKEKAEEYANEQDLRMAYNGSCDNCRQSFVVGANYVLDEIEPLIATLRSGARKLFEEKIKELKK